MEGLEEVKEGFPNEEDFINYGTDNLADIIGKFDKKVPINYYESLDEKQLYSYKLVGFKDIEVLAIK
ncbi:hypothetical protein [Tepidimicrobium xylanilyticum]|uniref:Uncharacterized protein n=1 Tax=Tepidimicrobium xylanilyticum TaxID=1123352 RepID=A0A1H3EK60_9FIRM|nr:hypothetical protein [Tepidimicrobium xylanilyticum]GMG96262.1 hypothetical protein EN5CB1_10880 [Tepidimicrobium xylanilyticum]SDX79071.1 hypothetical protein SAMN05660923_02942 [Tepidimicrobium xylanilyticum]